MIKIEMLRCFSTVAQMGNLAEAANRLGRTQSALSMTLKRLEEHLGGHLFESDRKSQLTQLGEQVLELAQTELRHFDETVTAIETSAKAPQGLLRIVSVPSVVGLIFPSVISTLTQRYPGLKIELTDADTTQVNDSLLRGRADVGIASAPSMANGIRQIPLFSDRFGLICSSKHPLARQETAPTIQQVISVGFIKNNLCKLIETPGFVEMIEDAEFTVHNTSSLIAMTRYQKWVTILPETVTQLAPNELAFREIAGLPDRRQVFLLLREKSPSIKFAEELSDLITEVNWDALSV